MDERRCRYRVCSVYNLGEYEDLKSNCLEVLNVANLMFDNGGPGENRTPTPLRALDFLTTLIFISSVVGVCGLDYALTVKSFDSLGPARLVSTPSEEISL